MTTPTSALGLSHIQTEFGGSNPIAISEYYGVNANVPGSGTLAMSKFLGISAATLTTRLDAETLSAHGTHSANCATIFWANGKSQQITDGDISTSGAGNYTWLQGGAAGDYEIRATKTSGTVNGTFSAGWANNTWAAMSTNRQFHYSRAAFGTGTVTVSISIRYTSNATVINTASTSISCESDK